MERNAKEHASAYFIQSHEEKVKQIALELHEHISQNLYSLYTGLEFLKSGLDEPSKEDHAKEMTALMGRVIHDIRLLSRELYPITLKDLGLTAALKSYIRSFSVKYGIVVHMDTSGKELELSESASLTIYRSCVEALLNIAKHANHGEAALHFTWEAKSVKIDIIDHGEGFNFNDTTDEFTGIAAMKHRLEMAGGSCELYSAAGEGTTVSLFLPVA